MSTIVTRAGKGSPLTHNEVDANFTNLNNDKVETSALSEAIDDRVAALAVAGTNMTITYNDGAGTLTFDAATGGGSGDVTAAAAFATDNVLIRSDGTGKGVQASAVLLDDNGVFTLPAASTPSSPASANMALFSENFAVNPHPFVLGPSDATPWPVQPMLGEGNYRLFLPANGTTVTSLGWPAITGQGTATAASIGSGSRRTNMQRVEYLVTVAATTAVAGARMNSGGFPINGASSWEGGFTGVMHGGPSTGLTNSSHRFYMGMGDTGASSDVEPSSLLVIAGIGFDSADANLQFMHNDGAGAATKVDLGASFAKPSSDRAAIYRLRLFAPPGTARSLSYEVTELESGAVASGTVTSNLPDVTSYVTPKMYSSVGGVSSVTGVAVGPWTFQTRPHA